MISPKSGSALFDVNGEFLRAGLSINIENKISGRVNFVWTGLHRERLGRGHAHTQIPIRSCTHIHTVTNIVYRSDIYEDSGRMDDDSHLPGH